MDTKRLRLRAACLSKGWGRLLTGHLLLTDAFSLLTGLGAFPVFEKQTSLGATAKDACGFDSAVYLATNKTPNLLIKCHSFEWLSRTPHSALGFFCSCPSRLNRAQVAVYLPC